MYIILVKNPQGNINEYDIVKNIVTIGRLPENDICLKDMLASREHAEIHCKNNQLILKDKGSRSGVIFQGTRIREVQLHPGDRFQIGEHLLEIRVCEKKIELGPEEIGKLTLLQPEQLYHEYFLPQQQAFILGRVPECDI